MNTKKYKNMAEFYPFYLQEHSNGWTKLLHFIGSGLGLICLLYAAWSMDPKPILYALLIGYGFAWVSHFFIEKNRPATFKYPLLSFISDWRMFFELLTGRRKFFS